MSLSWVLSCTQLAEGYVQAYTVAGALGLMYSLKLFRFLAINKQMATMWETLYRASGDLAAFLVGYVPSLLQCAVICHSRCW